MAESRFHKLEVEGDNYTVTQKRLYSEMINLNAYVYRSIDFAYDMTFAKVGEHRDNRTGGSEHRDLSERFQNAFQGKLAEFGVYDYIKSNSFSIEEPDLGVYGAGVWDDVDLTVNNRKISVKSTAHFSQLLLLEADDWDEHGYYLPNDQDEGNCYDFFVLCRVKPDIKRLFKDNNISPIFSRSQIKAFLSNQHWGMDIPGYITRGNLIKLIRERFILPKNSLLNGKTKMDADNIYCQAGDMWKCEWLIDVLNDIIPEDLLRQESQKANRDGR